jgi:hypothetical protein
MTALVYSEDKVVRRKRGALARPGAVLNPGRRRVVEERNDSIFANEHHCLGPSSANLFTLSSNAP